MNVSSIQAPSLRARLSRQFALQTMVGLSLVCGAVYLVISLTLSARQDDTLVKKRIAVQRLLKEGQEVHDIPGIKHLMSVSWPVMTICHWWFGRRTVPLSSRRTIPSALIR